jgi:hypothetical protein
MPNAGAIARPEDLHAWGRRAVRLASG